jgi:hypothetical protein
MFVSVLASAALIVSINTIAGGRSSERNLMDDYLQDIQPRKIPTTKTFTLKHPYKTRVASPHISTN